MDVDFVRHKFDDGHDGIVTQNRFKIGIRHVQILYMFACSMVLGLMRGSNGIAILAMTDVTRRNDTYIQIHNWDRRIQGTILSSFFIGYALILMPAELFLKRANGKFVLAAVLLVNGALSVAMPTIVNKGGWVAMCNAEFILGMTQACFSPASHSLLNSWLPPSEKSLLSSTIYTGIHFGIIIAIPISAAVSEARLGWELIFYSQSIITFSMAAVWILLTASSPDDHQALGDSEKEYIKQALRCYRKKNLSKPWRRIFKSPKFWAIACAHAASNAIFTFYLVIIPAYLQTVQNISWHLVSIFPFLAMWLCYITSFSTIEWLYKIGFTSYIFNVTYFRKTVNALGAFGIIIGLTIIPNLVPGWRYLAIIVLTGTLGLLGFQFSGFLENIKDISENYTKTILMMSSSFASVVGALVPLISGLILEDILVDQQRWRILFMILASLYTVCNAIYTLLGSSERQYWDGRLDNKHGYHNELHELELEELDYSKETEQINI